MSPVKIEKYALRWLFNDNKGVITLYDRNNTVIKSVTTLDPAVFHAAGAVLRNEKPVYFDKPSNTLMTSLEEAGEEET